MTKRPIYLSRHGIAPCPECGVHVRVGGQVLETECPFCGHSFAVVVADDNRSLRLMGRSAVIGLALLGMPACLDDENGTTDDVADVANDLADANAQDGQNIEVQPVYGAPVDIQQPDAGPPDIQQGEDAPPQDMYGLPADVQDPPETMPADDVVISEVYGDTPDIPDVEKPDTVIEDDGPGAVDVPVAPLYGLPVDVVTLDDIKPETVDAQDVGPQPEYGVPNDVVGD